jgi:glucosamine-6-phosphate deaminase
MTEIIVVKDENSAGELVAKHIAARIASNPKFILGVATGSTPVKVYDSLAKIVKSEGIDVSKVQGFALDEYVGIDLNHPESYNQVIKRDVVENIGFTPENFHVPNGALETIETAGADYDAMIRKAGGVDLQILGIGRDGHVGFNEPGSSLASRTRIKTLTKETKEDNARFFDSIDEVPSHCITQGVGTIMEAKHLVLLAFGKTKAEAIHAGFEGPITSSVTASVLQLHPHVTVVLDEAAASLLENLDYYKWAYENKPAWQGI